MINKVMSFDQWLEQGYNEPKGDSFKEWARNAKRIKAERVSKISDICDISSTTVLNIAKGDFTKEIYMEAIVAIANQPLVFNHKKEFFLVMPE
jgi:hypothetical protein